MSEKKTVTIKIQSAQRQQDYNGTSKSTGKPYTIYSWMASGTIDGQFEDQIKLKTMSQDLVSTVTDGATIQAQHGEFNGNAEYFIPKPRQAGGFGGGGGYSGKRQWIPENPMEKRSGVAMSYAVQLVVGGKVEVKTLLPTADKILNWMSSKVAGSTVASEPKAEPKPQPSYPIEPPDNGSDDEQEDDSDVVPF